MFRGEVAPPQLILADPDDRFIAAGELFLVDGKRDLWVLLGDRVTVVPIYDQALPYNDRVEDASLP